MSVQLFGVGEAALHRLFSALVDALAYLKALGISKAGYHAFRHFNTHLMDALRVPLKTIQERLGHALMGVFTLDVYSGQPDWERNLEAARLIGAELEKAVLLAKVRLEAQDKPIVAANAGCFGSLTSANETGSGAVIS
jgi:hypothetical protein